MKETFEVIILNGRPAAGKSEVIDYLKKTPVEERVRRFHIGEFEEIDDFPFVWESFEIDQIFTKYGHERLFTDERLYFKKDFIWTYFLERINLSYEKKLRGNPEYHAKMTTIVEFSRGGETAYKDSYPVLADEILKRAGIVYISVSYEESVRKNRRRFKPEQADSILFHSLPDEKMEFYYKTDDFLKIAPPPAGLLRVKDFTIPYSIFPNEPEVTDKPEALGKTLEETLSRLWSLKNL